MERAYRVLLADDEPIILESLKMAIPWDQYGMKVAGEARNGQEALEAAAVIKPDIIVSDIRMPVIDGIQFMRELKKGRMDQEPLFIVISGYGEFEYAREALRSGAFDYILKPIDHEELEEIVAKAKLELDVRRNRKLEEEQLQYSLQRLTAFAKERLYTEWMDGQPSFPAMQGDSDVELLKDPYCLFLVRLDRLQQASERWRTDEKRLWFFAVNNVLKEFGDQHGCFMVFPYYSGEWLLIFPEMTKEEKLKLGEQLVQVIDLCTKMTCTVGISSPAMGLEQLRSSYRMASDALRQAFVHTDQSVFLHGELNESSKLASMYPGMIEKRLIEAIKTLNTDEVEAAMSLLLKHLQQPGASKEGTVRICLEFAIVARRQLEMMIPSSPEVAEEDSEDILDALEQADSLTKLIKTLQERLMDWLHLAAEGRHGETGDSLIDQAKLFIDAHYQEDIGIEDVADFIHISCSHFCTLFKQKTGSTFLEYLTRLRIEKAEFILKNSEVKVFQIAPLVGYQDPRYFTQVFKKITGKTPTDYRISYQSTQSR
ncbi:two-component system response regulator [Paenibacillus sp. CAA11]|uniref:response regulator n=1 Tax=Paenibacillus sp. CAA11 TaxID=1532905 RepID=UPI000D38FC6C|nr:response regulator [Paenibacillus sp. CAA11]AWB45952.1 two-component system response regulator [Paenibacillus sp. CAA11]